MKRMIDINGLIKEFKDLDIDVSIYVDSYLGYTFNVAMDDITKDELDIIKKYADIDSIKIAENVRQFEINLSELKTVNEMIEYNDSDSYSLRRLKTLLKMCYDNSCYDENCIINIYETTDVYNENTDNYIVILKGIFPFNKWVDRNNEFQFEEIIWKENEELSLYLTYIGDNKMQSIGNDPNILMTFRQITNDDLYYEIVLVDIMCKCEECFKETRLLYKLNLEYGVYTCPICMLKHKTI